MTQGFHKALAAGEVSLEDMPSCFPVGIMDDPDHPDQKIRAHLPLDYKLVKELRSSVTQYGIQSSYTQSLLKSFSQTNQVIPEDWKNLASMILTGSQAMVWEVEWKRGVRQTVAAGNLPQGVMRDHLLGEGNFATAAQQLASPGAMFPILNQIILDALKKVDDLKSGTSSFASIKQKPNQLYSEFIDELSKALVHQIDHQEARELLLKKLAYENANEDCRAVLCPMLSTPNIGLPEYIQACRKVGSQAYQMEALAAALQSAPQFGGSRPSGNCFNCGKPGHFKAQCQALGGGATQAKGQAVKPKTICPKCKKGYHWARECCSGPQQTGGFGAQQSEN